MQYEPDAGFTEVGDRCFVARYSSYDVNVGVVVGDRGVVVIDTRASEPQGRELLEHLRRVTSQPVIAVLYTHWHFDHTFGTAALRDVYADVPVHAHEDAVQTLRDRAGELQDVARGEDDPVHADIAGARIVLPDREFASVRSLDLGDRVLEAVHLGRGHTSGDVLLRVPDADVVYFGDLVESSDRERATPGFGDDCYPLEWPSTLEMAGTMLTTRTVAVPGHGPPVDRDFVDAQQRDVADLAEMIRSLASRRVPVDDALAVGAQMQRRGPLAQSYGVVDPEPDDESGAAPTGWPFDPAYLEQAVRRGYAHLGSPPLPLADDSKTR